MHISINVISLFRIFCSLNGEPHGPSWMRQPGQQLSLPSLCRPGCDYRSRTVNVLVGDWPFQTGTNILVGNTGRTWYDGVSYAKVSPFQIQNVYPTGPTSVALVWNSPPSQFSLSTPTYSV
jgi:hypothetical protein